MFIKSHHLASGAASAIFIFSLFTSTCLAQTAGTTTGTTSATTDSVTPATDLFPDLQVGSRYYVGVKYLKDLGLIQGYPDGTFKPAQQINRAEALKILVGAIKYNSLSSAELPLVIKEATPDVSANSCPFPDLEKQAWYYSYVCGAYKDGVVSGYPDGTFKPEQTINKVEALKMDILQSGIPPQTWFNDNFNDVTTSDWFWGYAQIANAKSLIVEDRQGNLNPSETMNRGDFAMLVYQTIKAMKNNSEFGRASYYGGRFDGQGTADGETFQSGTLTAAHKTLPFNTIVRVTNLANGKQVTVRINDRGPYVNGTIIDLSTAAFAEIAPLSTGVVFSEVEIIPPQS